MQKHDLVLVPDPATHRQASIRCSPGSTPTPVFAVMAALMRLVAPVPLQTMALDRLLGGSETDWHHPGGGLLDASTTTTVETFLTRKAALPASLPVVV